MIAHPEGDAPVNAFRAARTDPSRIAREVTALARLLVSPARDRAADVYNLLSAHNNMGRDTLYLNMGYWETARTYDDACEALAMRVAERAQLAPGMRVLDAGYGFGDQDIAWARKLGVTVVGFNITESQVTVARERISRAGLTGQVDLRLGSALETRLPDASVDAVLAVESAFHFPTREAFFREAFRVLRPGGRIVLADLVLQRPTHDMRSRLARWLATRFWQMPEANLYGAREYLARLDAAGFEDASEEVISDRVFAPFARHAATRMHDADVIARVNPLFRAIWGRGSSEGVFDYAILSAVRPASRAESRHV